METGERDPRRRTGLSPPDETKGVDEALRGLLEPNPLVVERLVADALEVCRARSSSEIWWPRLAAAAVLVLLLISLIPDPAPDSPRDGDPTPVATAEPARISISNADGYVTISSTLGSKWILVTGDDS